ncbi:Ff.00g055450.m01.CDS01 [Fusarium sp. VM40]|nr:Ff.00g055450.m01.CDS01 [Fusarium sp. VM40]
MRSSSTKMVAFRLGSIMAAVSTVLAIKAPPSTADTYDYVVVGSGPGGGPLASNLARAGFKTLLLEAGDDESADPNSQVLAWGRAIGIAENLSWSYWVRHYDDEELTKQYQHLVWRLPNGDLWVGPGSNAPSGAEIVGVQYPRGATLGGSSIVNSGLTVLPSDSDWDYIKKITGDSSWNPDHMRRLFVKLERNQYLSRGTPGHGFDGYLKTNLGNGSIFLSSPQTTEILGAMAAEAGQNPKDLPKLLETDPNQLSPDRDHKTGLSGLSFHANSTWGRYSARERVLDTIRSVDKKGKRKYHLDLRLNSYATKVLFDKPKRGSKPRAIGIEYLEGKSIYQGDLRYSSSNNATMHRVYATREVILSGGSFSTPQLLLLSGVGPAADLKALKIPVVVNLPGVGRNMQDHNEIAVIGEAAQNISFDAAPGFPRSRCTWGAPNDPCYTLFLQGTGPYTEPGLNSDLTFIKTNYTTTGERDVAIFSGPFSFRGMWPATPGQSWLDPHNTWGIHGVHMHGKNRAGYLRLLSSDPTALPEINFRHFSSKGTGEDLAAMKEFVAWGRRAFSRTKAPVAPINITWPPCSGVVLADGSCSDATSDEDFIRQNTFGHHVIGTCSIGSNSDKDAVLDSKFRVRGISGLRVVDASAFPRPPGAFPILATYMLSEKAAEDILSG